MDTPMPPAFSVQNADGNTMAENPQFHRSDTGSLHKTTSAAFATNRIYDELDPVPVVESFLEWLILDDFGIQDCSASDVKIKRFLSAIYPTLSASCALPSTLLAPQTVQASTLGQTSHHGHVAQPVQLSQTYSNIQVGQSLQGESSSPNNRSSATRRTLQPGQAPPTTPTTRADQRSPPSQGILTQASGSGRSKIVVIGRTSKEVDDLTYSFTLQQQTVGQATIMEQQFRKETAKLFSYYVPTTYDEMLDPVRLFWGLLYELIVSLTF